MTAIATEASRDLTVAAARQALYRFVVLSLLDPKCGSWDQLRVVQNDPVLPAAAALLRSEPAAQIQLLAPGKRSSVKLDPQAALLCLPSSTAGLNEEFERTFGLLVSNACPPYETEYINSKFSFQRSNALADISGFYLAFGLTTSRTFPERPDHIVHELEFMAFLIGLTRQADEMPSPLREERLNVCCGAQMRFLREHVTWWTPTFARLLAKEASCSFYEEAADLLEALIAIERSLFCIRSPEARPSPSRLEQPDACDGCPITS